MTNISSQDTSKTIQKGQRPLKGRPYSFTEFAAKYQLDETEAARIFEKFGPSATELDILMAAKRKAPRTGMRVTAFLAAKRR